MTETEYYVQRNKLVNDMNMYRQAGDLENQAKTVMQMKQLDDRYEEELECATAFVSDLVKNKPDDIKEQFEEVTIRLCVLSDLIDTTTIDLINLLHAHTNMMQLSIGDDIKILKSVTSRIVKAFDDNSNEDTQEDYASFSEQLMPLIKKKSQEHLAWIQLEREKDRLYNGTH